MTVDVRHLRYFVAIAEAGSITAAAGALHLTQPALSRTLQQLEAHLGVRLVDRSTHHLALTASGHEQLDRAREALRAVEQALQPPTDSTEIVRLGHMWAALGRHTVPVLRRWNEVRPERPIRLIQVDDVVLALRRGEIDLGLVRGPTPCRGLGRAGLLVEARVAAVPSNHRLANRTGIRLDELACDVVVLNAVSGNTTLELWLGDARPTRTVSVQTTDDWLAVIASGQAVGVSTVATADIHTYPGVSWVPITDAPPVEVDLVWLAAARPPVVDDLLAQTDRLIAQHTS